MKFLKEKVTTKKTIGKILLETIIISAIISTIVIYLCLTSFSDVIQTVLVKINNGTANVFGVLITLLPVVVLISTVIKLGFVVMKKK